MPVAKKNNNKIKKMIIIINLDTLKMYVMSIYKLNNFV